MNIIGISEAYSGVAHKKKENSTCWLMTIVNKSNDNQYNNYHDNNIDTGITDKTIVTFKTIEQPIPL